MNKSLEKKLKNLPNGPGVYFYKDAKGEVIYVGKAKNLRHRISSYFQNKNHDLKTQKLVAEIVDLEIQEVETEFDALFLESEMIKRYMPRFNILLRDDKSQIFVRVGLKDVVPNVTFVRDPLDDGAEYVGPFYSSIPIKKALRVLRRVFPYYTTKTLPKSKLDRDLGLVPEANDENYIKDLKKLLSYLRGNRKALLREMEREMKVAAARHDFETAAILRNQVMSLKEFDSRILFGSEEFVDISKDRGLAGLAKILELDAPPRRIEAYDISHTGGQNVVGSMVVFSNGLADKAQYRKFKISCEKNDDFAALTEVLKRRFSGRHANWPMPDLVLLDGGAPQLRAVEGVLWPLNIPCVGVAKRNEEIVVPKVFSSNGAAADFVKINLHGAQHNTAHAKNLIGASKDYDDVVKLFQRIRDEAHRFAVNYHTLLRGKGMLK
ncbi:GIY-YIG nuclease family protein [Candidatus Saccharibacteria bacterium]|nr:GIY-YIG nuclease family protein [Candidatus Saccharibacteria bacterium]